MSERRATPRAMRKGATAVFVLLTVGCSNASGPETAVDGAQLFNHYCARCHDVDGSGKPDVPGTVNRLNDPNVMRGKSNQAIMGIIRGGKPPTMPGFGSEFTAAKLLVLTAYVRSLSQAPTERLMGGRPMSEMSATP